MSSVMHQPCLPNAVFLWQSIAACFLCPRCLGWVMHETRPDCFDLLVALDLLLFLCRLAFLTACHMHTSVLYHKGLPT